MKNAFINGKIYTGESIVANKALLISADTIVDIVEPKDVPNDFELVDLNGLNIAPAFIDLQVYGGYGEMFSIVPSVSSLTATYKEGRVGGAAWFQATIATNSLDIMLQAFEAGKSYKKQKKPGLIGIHLEGPYINVEKKGAHQQKFIRKPSVKEIEQLIKEGDGVFTMITLAPEICDPNIIAMLKEAGVVVSAGHSNCNYKTAKSSFENGVSTATHLYNAMPVLKNREPGLIGAIFDSSVYASIIPDGIHVDYASLRIAKKIMNERLFIITDAVTEYRGEDYDYIKQEDRYVTKNGVLAGSCITMMQAVQNCIKYADIEIEEVLKMASTYPAKVIKMDDELGMIKKGYKSNLIFFDDLFNLVTDYKNITQKNVFAV